MGHSDVTISGVTTGLVLWFDRSQIAVSHQLYIISTAVTVYRCALFIDMHWYGLKQLY